MKLFPISRGVGLAIIAAGLSGCAVFSNPPPRHVSHPPVIKKVTVKPIPVVLPPYAARIPAHEKTVLVGMQPTVISIQVEGTPPKQKSNGFGSFYKPGKVRSLRYSGTCFKAHTDGMHSVVVTRKKSCVQDNSSGWLLVNLEKVPYPELLYLKLSSSPQAHEYKITTHFGD